MVAVISGPSEPAREDADAGDENPRLGTGDRGFEVLCQTPMASDPSEGALDHPALRLGFERSDVLGTGNDLNRPPTQVGERIEQSWAAIDAVGKDVTQFGELLPERSQ